MIRALLPPVLAVCALSAVVALPGVFVGQYSACPEASRNSSGCTPSSRATQNAARVMPM